MINPTRPGSPLLTDPPLGQIFSVASEKSANTTIFFLKQYERKTDSKLISFIDFLWFLTTTENNQPKQVKPLIWPLLGFCVLQNFFLPPI